MKPLFALMLVFAGSAAHAQDVAKLFSDQGKTYLRSEGASSLVPGAELSAFSDPGATKSVGKVVVMEVTGQLVRVSFDDDATKAQAKYVRLSRGGPPAAAAGAPPPPPPPPPGLPPSPATLQATLVRGGGYILVRNDSKTELTGCNLTFPDRRYAPTANVAPGMAVQVRYGDIKPAPNLGNDWVLVRCAEGEAELFFDQPTRPNVLRGRAEGRGGGVVLYNDGPTDWSQCDIIKPNGHHFMQGSLRASSSDSIRGALFKPPSGPEIITLSCVQGSVSKPVP